MAVQTATRRQNVIKAEWRDPDLMPIGQTVQVRLANGDIHDGVKDKPDGLVWVWDAFGGRVKGVKPMGWLPKHPGFKAVPEQQLISINDVADRMFSALRTLRAMRLKMPPLHAKTFWPDIVREFSDMTGTYDDNGIYISRSDYDIAPDEQQVREIYTPEPYEFDQMDGPLKWFSELRGRASTTVGTLVGADRSGPKPADIHEMTASQNVVWDRSYAYLAPAGLGSAIVPPSWRLVGEWNGMSYEQARSLFQDTMRTLWWIANGGKIR